MHERRYSLVVFGSGGVGKSALTIQFVNGTFAEKYDPTIEDFYRKHILVDGVQHTLEILDTAGTGQFSSLHDLYIKNGQCFLIVFSLISRQTFVDSGVIRDNILRIKRFSGNSSNSFPMVLVGNKADLAAEGHREVSVQEARERAAQWGCPYVETSARDNTEVNMAFIEVVKQMLAHQPKRHSRCSLI